ncbi:MAG TPA: PAS domain-containing protein [Sphingobium sp.]|nr:PAS domain-containing protein [Sphingobium sp.]
MSTILPSAWPRSVSAAELVRNFAECREVSAQHSLPVTHHGRTTHVLIGIDAFNRLKGDGRDGPMPDPVMVYALADWLEAGLILCDEHRTIQFVNRVAQGMARAPAHGLVGSALLDALPALAGSLIDTHLRRTEAGGEIGTGDIPSPFSDACWLRFRSFPLGPWNALLFHDITGEVRQNRMADEKQALSTARALHGGVCFARLSVRGTIDSVNDPCCRLVGLAEERLRGVAFADLVPTAERPAFREGLEAVLRGEGDRAIDTRLLTNDGALPAVRASLTQLRGAYGVEGALLLATATAEARPAFGPN